MVCCTNFGETFGEERGSGPAGAESVSMLRLSLPVFALARVP
jgi:hypothetical protein